MSQILLTGFRPFQGETVNPSELLCLQTSNLEQLVLPVEYKKSFEVLSDKIKQDPPKYLIMLGQAAGRSVISLEKIALNWVQTRLPDESGYVPPVGKIQDDLPLAYLSQFPIDQFFEVMKLKHSAIGLSFSAGTFVCNYIYFKMLSEFPDLKSVFIHVPLLPEQLKERDLRPAMTLNEMQLFLNDLIDSLRRD